MPFVLDCSTTMAWVFPDEANAVTDSLRESLLHDHAIVPPLWAVEVANVILVATRRKRILQKEWPRLIDILLSLPLITDDESSHQLFKRTLPLAHSYNLSTYDAIYLEIAQRKNLPLATLDKKLKQVCKKLGVKTL